MTRNYAVCPGDEKSAECAGSSMMVLDLATVSGVVPWNRARGSEAMLQPFPVTARRIS